MVTFSPETTPPARATAPGAPGTPAWLAAENVIRGVVARQLRAARDSSEVDDVVQETWLRLSAMSDAPSAAYAVGVAKHVAIDALRRKVRTARIFDSSEGAGDDVADTFGAPASHATSLDAQAAIRALDALPPQHARALYMFHAEDKSYEHIAREMGTSIGSVATWISRARMQLRAQLGVQP